MVFCNEAGFKIQDLQDTDSLTIQMLRLIEIKCQVTSIYCIVAFAFKSYYRVL